ncbi:MAG TPA: glycerate kinase [Nitrospirota bacterium]|nr:glycerate kinase [Nitrospirota bacterium]
MDIFNAALAAVDPYKAVRRSLRLEDGRIHAGDGVYELDAFDRIMVVGAGKATARMAMAAEGVLGDAVKGGIIIVKYGHTGDLKRIEQVEAAHPIPDEAGVEGTKRILELVRNAGERNLILCLLSGGGSALLVAPVGGITLEDKQRVTDLLLRSGASIGELNAVRKHLSAVKGGRLARTAYPASLVTLILSDVIGDRLDVIASGPTAPDGTTFADAALVVDKFGLKTALPPSVARFLERGLAGLEAETVKSGDACFGKTRNVIVGGLARALAVARDKAEALGYAPEIITSELRGEARDAAHMLAQKAEHVRGALKAGERRCLLSGGETTVTVSGTGTGGRNQELALAFAQEIAGAEGIVLLSAGTDGTDGPTDAAGAVVDGSTVKIAGKFDIHSEVYLERNDSYAFFAKLDRMIDDKHHIITGPTGTNVMDLQVILVEGKSES